jgi:hypothetical protein
MSKHLEFEAQLDNLRQEASIAARYIYADMAIQHAASKSKRLLHRLNSTPTFWIACGAAFQSAAYVALGRVFDTKSRYNVAALLDTFEGNLHLFGRDALARRKRNGKATDPPWLSNYLDKAYYPSRKDVVKLRTRVESYRLVYDRAIKPARHKYIAHREKRDPAEVSALFARGTVRELWRMSTFLLQLHDVLWELLYNGKRPRFRTIRYSVKAIFDAPSQSSQVHESIVKEVKDLMRFLESATPNQRIHRTVQQRRFAPLSAGR